MLDRFLQPDSIVPRPGNPQSLNRYAYVGNRPVSAIDPSGFCTVAPSASGADDRAHNLAYAAGADCWRIYDALLDQGIPGLDWQWDYALGQSIAEFASANYATGAGASLGLAGALSYEGYDIIGYQLLSVGGNVALINGSPTYHMYVDEQAAYAAQVHYYAYGLNDGCTGVCSLVSMWVGNRNAPAGLRGRADRLVPFTTASDLGVAAFTKGSQDYIRQTSYVYSGAQYLDIWWDISGLAAFGHSVGAFKWASANVIDYAKLVRSGISTGRSIGGIAASLAVDPVKISDLANKLQTQPIH